MEGVLMQEDMLDRLFSDMADRIVADIDKEFLNMARETKSSNSTMSGAGPTSADMNTLVELTKKLQKMDPVYQLAEKYDIDLSGGYILMIHPFHAHVLGIEDHPKVQMSRVLDSDQIFFLKTSLLGLPRKELDQIIYEYKYGCLTVKKDKNSIISAPQA
jgi:hypothetical protein